MRVRYVECQGLAYRRRYGTGCDLRLHANNGEGATDFIEAPDCMMGRRLAISSGQSSSSPEGQTELRRNDSFRVTVSEEHPVFPPVGEHWHNDQADSIGAYVKNHQRPRKSISSPIPAPTTATARYQRGNLISW